MSVLSFHDANSFISDGKSLPHPLDGGETNGVSIWSLFFRCKTDQVLNNTPPCITHFTNPSGYSPALSSCSFPYHKYYNQWSDYVTNKPPRKCHNIYSYVCETPLCIQANQVYTNLVSFIILDFATNMHDDESALQNLKSCSDLLNKQWETKHILKWPSINPNLNIWVRDTCITPFSRP